MKKNTKIIFSPKKELGQNFIFNDYYLNEITKKIPINEKTIIIEIGSGYGNLTKFLSNTKCKKIISIEKDKKIFQWLKKNIKDKKIIFLNNDALKINWEKLCISYINFSLIIVGNLPYNIANSLLIKLLIYKNFFSIFVFLVQKELAEKWTSGPKKNNSKYSALSVFINCFSEIKKVLNIPKNIFIPKPKVDGTLLIIKKKDHKFDEKKKIFFLNFVKKCFFFRRKNILKNLSSEKWKKFFLERKYSFLLRPQEMDKEFYLEIFEFDNIN